MNKARYKFLGLNLDYSIAKAERILGYQPPYYHRGGSRRVAGRPRRPRPLADPSPYRPVERISSSAIVIFILDSPPRRHPSWKT